MTIQIFSNQKPDVNAAVNIYLQLGWGTAEDYNLSLWQQAYNHSDFISAYDNEQLVGFIRLLSDGVHDTQVLEFAVMPNYQSQGVSSQLLDALKTQWGHTDIYCNALDKNLAVFLANRFKKHSLTGVSRAAA